MKNYYSINVFYSEEDECFVAISPEFGDQMAGTGETRQEAIAEAETAIELLIEDYEEEGDMLPEARKARNFSGNISLRIPKSLHQQVAKCADHEDVSMNQYINYALTAAVTGNEQAIRTIDYLERLKTKIQEMLIGEKLKS